MTLFREKVLTLISWIFSQASCLFTCSRINSHLKWLSALRFYFFYDRIWYDNFYKYPQYNKDIACYVKAIKYTFLLQSLHF